MQAIKEIFLSPLCNNCFGSLNFKDSLDRVEKFQSMLPKLSQLNALDVQEASENQAQIILRKTQITPQGKHPDRYNLGFCPKDRKIFMDLSPQAQHAFNHEIQRLVEITSLRWDQKNHKGRKGPSQLSANATQVSNETLGQIRNLRRRNLLSIARSLLLRYKNQHTNLIAPFGCKSSE